MVPRHSRRRFNRSARRENHLPLCRKLWTVPILWAHGNTWNAPPAYEYAKRVIGTGRGRGRGWACSMGPPCGRRDRNQCKLLPGYEIESNREMRRHEKRGGVERPNGLCARRLRRLWFKDFHYVQVAFSIERCRYSSISLPQIPSIMPMIPLPQDPPRQSSSSSLSSSSLPASPLSSPPSPSSPLPSSPDKIARKETVWVLSHIPLWRNQRNASKVEHWETDGISYLPYSPYCQLTLSVLRLWTGKPLI